jgi:hypothetical protein
MRRLLPLIFVLPAPAFALGELLPTPPDSLRFGTEVLYLPNGNFVVTDPGWSDDPNITERKGAVYLYGADGSLLSRLTGSSSDDDVGSGGIVILATGNFVVRSPFWDAPGDVQDAGAVTFGNADTGFGPDAQVNADNSLIGAAAMSRVGDSGVFALPNGDYVVASDQWGPTPGSAHGAVTWGDGSNGTSGEVGPANSLLGTHDGDHVGTFVTVLTDGNYVVASPSWDSDTAEDIGAVTLRLGDGPIPAIVSDGNSLTGSKPGDQVGLKAPVALANGNFVFASPKWDNDLVVDAGAVTWHAGDEPTSGSIGIHDSLIGSTQGDAAGSGDVIALDDGNYGVSSPEWDRGPIVNAGAVTLGDGKSGTLGIVGIGNSVVGSSPLDALGGGGITAVGNGGFVATSPLWNDGASIDIGVAIRVDATYKSGEVDGAAALRGSFANDLEFARVTPLANGSYVIAAPFADRDNAIDAGAVVWCPAQGDCSKQLSATHALVGTRANDIVGNQRVQALGDGNFVVFSPFVDTDTAVDAGAVTWIDGTAGLTGEIGSTNSMLGRSAGDHIGATEGVELPDSSFAFFSPLWSGAAGAQQGAMTFAPAGQPLGGVADEGNSMVAPSADDRFGLATRAIVTADGRVIAAIPRAANAGLANAGAIVVIDPAQGAGVLDYDAGIRGAAQDGQSMRFDWHEGTQMLVASDPGANRVWLANLGPLTDAIFRDGFE